MTISYIKKSIEILRKEGPLEVAKQSKSLLWFNGYYRPMMRVKYGKIRPIPGEKLVISPTRIDYRTAPVRLPDDRPPYGIIDGDWDLKKIHWKNEGGMYLTGNNVFYGLIERFEEGKNWEDTVYYQAAIERLESNESFAPLSGPQTVSGLKRYLEYLDKLYKDIEENGYDMSSVLRVYIGRNGEFIVVRGNHRLTIARITDIKKVPVRIQYRHKQWQELRNDIYNNGFSEKHNKELRNHPDLPYVHET